MGGLRKCVLALAAIPFFASFAAAQAPTHIWSAAYDGPTSDAIGRGSAVALDASGNVIVAGSFYGTIDLGGGVLSSAGEADLFVAKYDASGNYLWSRRFGDFEDQQIAKVAVDRHDDVILTGYFEGAIDFGGGLLTAAGGDMYAAKLTSNGAHVWSYHFGDLDPNTYESPTSITTDQYRNVIVVGEFSGTLDFGGGLLLSDGSAAFAVKFGLDGSHVWSARLGEPGEVGLGDVVCDSEGNVYIGGSFRGSIDLGGGLMASAGYQDAFLAKFDADGDHIWSHRYGDAAPNQGISRLALDSSENIVVSGSYQGTMDFGGGALPTAPNEMFRYLVKLDCNAGYLWHQAFAAGTTGLLFRDIDIDANDNILVTGASGGDLGGGVLGGPIFIAIFGTNGGHVWSQGFGSDGIEMHSLGIAAGDLKTFAVTGIFWGTLDFGGGPLISGNSYDAFVATFGCGSVPTLLSSFTASCIPTGVEVSWRLSERDPDLAFSVLRTEVGSHQFYPLSEVQLLVDGLAYRFVDEAIESGRSYRYRVIAVTERQEWLLFETQPVEIPLHTFGIVGAYPNPFNPGTTIRFSLARGSATTLRICDPSGRIVRTLVDELRNPGDYDVEWNGLDAHGNSVASGVYFAHLSASGKVSTSKIVHLK